MVAGRRIGRTLVAGGVGLGLLLAPVASIAKPGGGPRYVAGASGAGDPYFPYSGNGGYDVKRYRLDLTYTPPAPDPAPLSGQLEGVAGASRAHRHACGSRRSIPPGWSVCPPGVAFLLGAATCTP